MEKRNSNYIKNILILSVIIMTYLPFIYYWINTPNGMSFNFTSTLDADFQTYLFKMKLGEEGYWLYQNFFVFENNNPNFIFIFYILLGKISGLLQINSMVSYHVIKIIFSYLTLHYLYKIISMFFVTKKQINLIFLFTSLLSLNSFQFEIFNSLANYPHFAFTYYLLFIIIYKLFKHYRDPYFRIRDWIKISIINLLMVLVAPYMIVPITIIYILLFVKKESIKNLFFNLIKINILAVIFDLYLLIAFQTTDYEKWIDQANIGVSSSFAVIRIFLFIFSVPLLFSIVKIKKIDFRLSAWSLTYLICLLLPVSFQVRLFFGMNIAFCLLMFYCVSQLELKNKLKYILKIYFILVFILISSKQIIFFYPMILKFDQANAASTYINNDSKDVITWINQNHIKNKKILANIDISSWIPGMTFNKVYIGHYSLSYNLSNKIEKIKSLKDEEDIKEFINELNIDYLIAYKENDNITQEYKKLLSYFEVLNNKTIEHINFTKLYENNGYVVYHVKNNKL
jgi:hypothetical protein